MLLRMRGDDGELDPTGGLPVHRRALRADPGDRPLGRRPRRSSCSPSVGARARTRTSRSTSAARTISDADVIEFIVERVRTARHRSHATDVRGHRDDGDREHRPRARVRAPPRRSRLPVRARRLRRRLRLVLLPQAPAVRLPQDRRRVHREPAADRPTSSSSRRSSTSRAASASRRSPSSSATTATIELLRDYGRRLRPGLPPRQAQAGPPAREPKSQSHPPERLPRMPRLMIVIASTRPGRVGLPSPGGSRPRRSPTGGSTSRSPISPS